MITTIVFDVGETLTRDDRNWGSWADWLGVPRHTLSALVGAAVAHGRDNAEALRLVRPGLDLAVEVAAREAAGFGEYLDDGDLYDDVRPGLSALRDAGYAVHIAGNQTARAGELLRALDLPADTISTSQEWGVAKPDEAFFAQVLRWQARFRTRRCTWGITRRTTSRPLARSGCVPACFAGAPGGTCGVMTRPSCRIGVSTASSNCPNCSAGDGTRSLPRISRSGGSERATVPHGCTERRLRPCLHWERGRAAGGDGRDAAPGSGWW